MCKLQSQRPPDQAFKDQKVLYIQCIECLQYGLPFKIDYHKKIQNGLPFQIIIRKVVYFEDINCLT